MTVDPIQTLLQNTVHDYVAAATGLAGNRIVIGEANVPSPIAPYASIIERVSGGKGTPSVKHQNHETDDTQTDYKIKRWGITKFSVKVFKSGAMDRARTLKDFQYTPIGQLLLEENNVVFKNASEARNITAIYSDEFEEVAQIDLELQYIEKTEQTVNSLKSAEIIINVSAETDITELVEVSTDG